MTSFTLSRIRLYPIKSLDGMDVSKCELLAGGGLRDDRRYAIVDASGNWVNGKRTPQLHRLAVTYEDAGRVVVIGPHEHPKKAFHLQHERKQLESWLSDYLEQRIAIQENRSQGFPDDTEAAGPTLCGVASLAAVAEWFEGLSAEEIRRRMRANLEVEGCPAFWEDGLVAARGVPFAIGSTRLEGLKACARCVVPTRDSRSGEASEGFSRHFMERRAMTLQSHVEREAFAHFYRFALNTRVLEPGWISVGDSVAAT